MRSGLPTTPKRLPFLVLAAAVLLLFGAGLVIRVSPGLPERLGLRTERSLIPLHFLDLVGVALLLLLLYATLKRQQVRRLSLDLVERENTTRSIATELAELGSIYSVSSRVNTFRDVPSALRFIAHTARECLDAAGSTVFILEKDGVEPRAFAGEHPLEARRVAVGDGVAGWVAKHRRPLLLNTRRDLEVFLPQRGAVGSALSVPLLVSGNPLGVLTVTRTGEEHFEERHLKLLRVFADYAANTINGLRLYEEVSDAHARMEKAYRELRQIQGQLIHAEKMSAIGQLISEVSHELNNPLTTAIGYAQLLKRVNRDPEVSDYLDTIEEEGMRCQRIIQNLLDFARKNRGERQPVSVNELIEKTIELRAYQLRIDGVEVQRDLDPLAPPCVADPTRLQQVFLNLLNNAGHALENGGGTVRFGTHFDPDSEEILVTVGDSGPGVPPGLAEQIFDPFFTTKPAGKGTGLGLSICRSIVEEQGGSIRVTRDELGGARFEVVLPVTLDAARVADEPALPPTPDQAGRVLVVDDEMSVRRLLVKALRLDGHEAVAVANAAQALERVRATPFDLVMTDLRMPGMTGLELYRALGEAHPDLVDRVVFFTGTALAEDAAKRVADTGRALLMKPFRFDEVRRVVRTVLAEAGGPRAERIELEAPSG